MLISRTYRPPGQNVQEIDINIENLQGSIDRALIENPTSKDILRDFNDRCLEWNSNHTSRELGNKLVNLIKTIIYTSSSQTAPETITY